MCWFFLIMSFFYSENSSTYFKVSFRSLQIILIVRDVLECKLEVEVGICADRKQAKAFWFSEGRKKV